MLALLEGDEGPDVAFPAGGGELSPGHGTRRIRWGEQIPVCRQLLKCRRISSVATFTANPVPPVRG